MSNQPLNLPLALGPMQFTQVDRSQYSTPSPTALRSPLAPKGAREEEFSVMGWWLQCAATDAPVRGLALFIKNTKGIIATKVHPSSEKASI